MQRTPFETAIPENIAWIPNRVQEQCLAISERQLRRDKGVLRELEIAEFPRGGCERESFKVLWEFRELVGERGRAAAISEIAKRYL